MIDLISVWMAEEIIKCINAGVDQRDMCIRILESKRNGTIYSSTFFELPIIRQKNGGYEFIFTRKNPGDTCIECLAHEESIHYDIDGVYQDYCGFDNDGIYRIFGLDYTVYQKPIRVSRAMKSVKVRK